MLSRKQLEMLTGFSVSAVAYGIGLGILGLYYTEWKPVVRYIPYFNRHWKDGMPPKFEY